MENQINEKNKIEIYIQDDTWNLKFLAQVFKAYIKYKEYLKHFAIQCMRPENYENCKQSPRGIRKEDFHDLGLLHIGDGETFQNLKIVRGISGDIVPLCLPSEDAQIDEDKEITMVGYGNQYKERPTDNNWNVQNRNPTDTTCTTNEYGVYWDTTPKRSKFKPCAIEFMKDNNWGCKKGYAEDMLPIGYEFDVCEDYWRKARWFMNTMPSNIQTAFFANAKKIKIISQCTDWIPECLHYSLFEMSGWCRVKNGNLDDWGICDVSCKYAKV